MIALKILRYQLKDVLRSRWLLGYGAFFLLLSDAFFRFGGDGPRVILSLMNVVLLIVPLMAVVLGTMFLYSSREYIELLLTQPLRRSSLFAGLYAGLVLPLAGAFVAGTALPFLLHGALFNSAAALGVLLVTGILLTAIFVAVAFALALRTEDRIRGLGMALGVWLFAAVLYNGLVLLVIQVFHRFPMQQAVIGMSLLNPVDLGRIFMLLNLDAAALMGFTGAVFDRFFGSVQGQLVSIAALACWMMVPLLAGRRTFLRKNF